MFTIIDFAAFSIATTDQIIINPTWRQNFRLYFDRMPYKG